jgi:hypothetical protein
MRGSRRRHTKDGKLTHLKAIEILCSALGFKKDCQDCQDSKMLTDRLGRWDWSRLALGNWSDLRARCHRSFLGLSEHNKILG